MTNRYKISKILSANDTGETKAHQAGILIPKEERILRFFPRLDSKEKNPRTILIVRDSLSNKWKFNFIYYNNKFFGGTRNEYRLTGMTGYIKSNNLKAGDEIFLEKDDENRYFISYKKTEGISEETPDYGTRLKLGNKWKIISF